MNINQPYEGGGAYLKWGGIIKSTEIFNRYLISLAWWNHFMEEKDTGNESDVINMPAISNESLVEFRRIISNHCDKLT